MKKHAKKIIVLLLAVAMIIPTVAMLYSSAATSFTVELAFENLFVLDHWVINKNSMNVTNDAIANSSVAAYDVGSVSNINLQNGSFRLTNKTTENVYTVASMGQGEYTKDNFDYYRMPVEEGATYDFSYNITGNVPGFFPFVFFYDESNEFKQAINGAANSLGDNTYRFTVPEGIKYIQIRLTLAGNADKSAYADIKNIAIYKVEYVPAQITELFDYNAWYNTNSKTANAYTQGTLTTNPDMQSLTLTSNAKGTASNAAIFTGLSLGSTSGFYTINVNPGKTYRVTYNISDQNLTQVSDIHSFIVWSNASTNNVVTVNGLPYLDTSATKDGKNTYEFIVPDNVSQIQVVFGLYEWNNVANKHVTVSDISLYEVLADSIIEHKVDPVRKTYTYNSENNGTYGTLPNPPAATYPEGYIFAGWYTEKDGKGIRIASDTPILPQSYTVYPKFEPEVDNLTVATPPTKTEYTKGEKLNTAGLVLRATVGGQTIDVPSGYYCTPEYLNTVGTQPITVHYGGETTTFNVNVSSGTDKNIVVNGNTHAVTVANNEYTINFHPNAPFNRYEITYFSDSYVKGEITMDTDTEVFFLEPSDNGSFASYIDSFLARVNHYNVDSIKFTCLDKDFGNFELLSLTTIAATVPANPTQYYENSETGYKVGIDLRYGGVVSEIYDLENMTAADPVVVRVYTENGKDITRVDHRSILNRDFGTNYKAESTNVNLINTNDRGRYLQQSYYGTSQKPFEMGDYNGEPWPYNPVQGGNLQIQNSQGQVIKGNEASKVIDYRITDDQIYIKTRPLDWGKNSEDYPDSYVTDSYMEAWYVFEDGMIKTYCRFVDYSGYPAHTRDQELPAVYIIEPLNNFVYNDVAAGSKWTTTNYAGTEEPDFWGVLPSYNDTLTANKMPTVDVDVVCNENWAAFTASQDAGSFGVGVYSAGVTDFHYGCFPAKYSEDDAKVGKLTPNTNRHTASLDPAIESPTSYISPVGQMTFESYKPIEYSYYLTTGTAKEIHDDFKTIALKDNQADADKPKIAVPETVYMAPTNDANGGLGVSKVGQYYVNNIMNESNNNNVVTEAKRDAGMYLGLSIKDAKEFSVKITNVTNPSNDIFLCNTSGSEISESTRILFGAAGTFKDNTQYGLRFSGTGLQPGEKATAKWEITVYFNDGSSKIYTAYTVMYAPHRTVGSVAEARQNEASQNEISSWITGANGVDHSTRIALGSFEADLHDSGYFLEDPLTHGNTPPTSSTGRTSNDLIYTIDPSKMNDGGINREDDYSDTAYVLQAATDDHGPSRAHSYLGLLTVDKSRYSNTDQIPNLRIGYDVLRIGSAKSNSVGKYATFYTLGTADAFVTEDLTKSPSGWTMFEGEFTDFADSHNIPYRNSFTPSFDVSTIDGKYIHALGKTRLDSTWADRQYSTAGTSVLCSVTDKSGLRDAVLNGYTIVDDDPEFNEALENAATVLGNPSATQPEIDEAKKELNNALEDLIEKFYALKYDNLFSAYEFSQHSVNMTTNAYNSSVSYSSGTITVNSNGSYVIENGVQKDKVDVYTNYNTSDNSYLITLKPETEYVFEFDVVSDKGWQSYLFFYDENGNGVAATDRSVQADSGTPSNIQSTDPHFGVSGSGTNGTHRVVRFKTPENIGMIGLRFGNINDTTVTSTFSNIRLVEASKYYADVTYAKTEDVYKEYASYGTLPTLTRPGYRFGGWADAAGNAVTGADIATTHKSIFSVWTEYKYTIVYHANGGSGTIANQTVTYTENVDLASTGFTKQDYTLIGWSTNSNATSAQYQLGQKVSKLTNVNNGSVTLYAVWANAKINVTFDNMFDLNKFNISTDKLEINKITDTRFKVTSKSGNDANTGFSYAINVEPGKTYILSADIISFTPGASNQYDMYVQALDKNLAGEKSFTPDSGVGVEGDVHMVKHGSSAGKISLKFTAGNTTEFVKIRFDANNAGSVLEVDNIRFFEDTGITVSPVNKQVTKGSTFGELPVPTRSGFVFAGWFEGETQIKASTAVTQTSTVHLTSKWVANDYVLAEDKSVVDFGSAIEITPLGNDDELDKIAKATDANYKVSGISKDGANYSTEVKGAYGTFKVSGNNVTYTPSKAMNGVETISYQASITTGNVTTKVNDTITIVPASNVLYEETFFTENVVTTAKAWTSDGTATNANQVANDTVYGYDESYYNDNNHSSGSAYKVTVDSTNRSSNIMKFEFKGTGFDLNSVCGPTTGVFIISIQNKDTGAFLSPYVIDTYYSDSNYGNDNNGNLYQVPILHATDLPHAKYLVQVSSSYLPTYSGAIKNPNHVQTQALEGTDGMTVNTASVYDDEVLRATLIEMGMEDALEADEIKLVWFDEDSVLNGGMGANTPKDGVVETASTEEIKLDNYIDSVRVYNPIENGNDYYIATEQNATYINIINNLLEQDKVTGSGIVAYVSGNSYVDGTDKYNISLDSYKLHGPKDELYLSQGTVSEGVEGITFTIKDFSKIKTSGTRVMISVRAASGTPTLRVNTLKKPITSKTEMYYDITDPVVNNNGIVVIQNTTAGTLLAIGSIKITSESAEVASISSDVDLELAKALMFAVARDVDSDSPVLTEPAEPEVPVEPEIPVDPEVPADPENPADDNNDTTDKPETDDGAADDSSECWLMRLINWVIEKFVYFFNLIKSFLNI